MGIKFTIRKTMRIISYALILFVFLPSFLVSCSNQTIEVNVMTAVGGLESYGQKIADPHPIMIVCLLLPLLFLVLLYTKKISDKKTSLIVFVSTIIDFVVWLIFRYEVKKVAAENYCEFKTTAWYFINAIFIVVLCLVSFMVIKNVLTMEDNLLEKIKKINISKNIDINSSQATFDNTENKKIVKSLKEIPKKVWVIIAGLAVAIAVTIFLIIQPPTIDLNKYIIYDASGYDGYGQCTIKIDWDAIKDEYGDKVKYSNKTQNEYGSIIGQSPIDIIKNNTELCQDVSDKLHNGDVVKFTLNVNNENLINNINCQVRYSDGIYTISNLEEANKIDFFSSIKESLITFSGRNGNAYATFNENLANDLEIYRDDNFIIVLKENYHSKYFEVIKDNKSIASIGLEIDNNSGLSNGDDVNVYLSDPLKLVDYGYLPETDCVSYTVADRPELLSNITKQQCMSVEEYLDSTIPEDSEYYSYSNADIHRVYFGKAKETTVTDNITILLVDYSYSSNYHSSWISSNSNYDNYYVFKNIYFENDEFKSEYENKGYYYSWSNETIEDVMNEYSSDYDFELVWE